MSNIFFISDTHFGHANFLKFTDYKGRQIRPFSSVEEMDEYMIERWNADVRPQDKVYHLGDVTFDIQNFSKNIAPRLNGHKRLIVGNHDNVKNFELTRWFDKISVWRYFGPELVGVPFTATHVPITRAQFCKASKVNVHGHIHQNELEDWWYQNICVEHTDYSPVSMELLQLWLKARVPA